MATLHRCDLHEFNETYLCALRARDRDTEVHFIRYFTSLLQLKLRKRMYPADRVNDVVQETFLRILKKLRSEDPVCKPECLGAYVNSMCNNIACELFRSDTRWESLEDLVIDPLYVGAGPDAILVAQETRNKVHKVLARLAPKDRGLLRSVFLEQRDKDEICRELNVTRDYLRVLLLRAKEQFRNLCEIKESQPVKISLGWLKVKDYSQRKEIMGSIRATRRAGR